MKIKVVSFILLAALVAMMIAAGCTSQPATPTQTAPTSSQPAPTTPAAKVFKWKGQTTYADSPEGVGSYVKPIETLTSASTHGQIQLTLAPPGSIVPVAETFNAVSTGILDFALYYGTYHEGIMPETAIEVGLPYAWDHIQDAWAAYYRYGLIDEVRKLYAAKGVYYLAPAFSPIVYAPGCSFAANSPADVKGKKIRAVGATAKVIEYLGGSPVVIPPGDAYMAIKLGTLDGAYGGMLYLDSIKLYEVAPYFNRGLSTGMASANVIVNLKSWNALPEELKKDYAMFGQWITDEQALRQNEQGMLYMYAKKNGMKIIDFSLEDLRKVQEYTITNIWEETAKKSAAAARMVEIVRTQMRDIGKIK